MTEPSTTTARGDLCLQDTYRQYVAQMYSDMDLRKNF
jgi:hypothetical protein